MSEQTKKRTRNKLACTNSDFENELVIAVPGEGGWDEVEGAGRKNGENRQLGSVGETCKLCHIYSG